MKSSQMTAKITTYTPLMLVWALLCLVVTASFQYERVSAQAELTKQSPLAQFNHVGSHYSLRFNGAQLDDDGDDLAGLVSEGVFPATTQYPAPSLSVTQVVQRARAFLHLPRAPPNLLK
ncbi:hypothetical protein D210916BOD24_04760 [Alteromonas sp. D210916BOD_24]|uniref:hypothetical protein n=1 Tax=Alteromonas sp. D210916BOD_24 TaxID=3157618 RepID=UPI00399C7082